MSKSLKYTEVSGINMTLESFKVKQMQNIDLTSEEKIVELFLQERVDKLTKEIEER